MNFLPQLLALLLLAPVATGKPNFLVILVDDMGWRDVGFAGNDFIDTPHIDSLARNGTVFTQAYASAPNCAPTRASLMTGQYPPRHGIFTVVDDRVVPINDVKRAVGSYFEIDRPECLARIHC